jgi:addiction module HigA family antidote
MQEIFAPFCPFLEKVALTRIMKKTPKEQNDNAMKDVKEILEGIHPGEVLLRDFMKPRGLTPDQMMKETGMPVENINELIEDKRKITPAIASVLELCLGPSAQNLVLCQSLYDWKLLGLESKIRTEFLKFDLKILEFACALAKVRAFLGRRTRANRKREKAGRGAPKNI